MKTCVRILPRKYGELFCLSGRFWLLLTVDYVWLLLGNNQPGQMVVGQTFTIGMFLLNRYYIIFINRCGLPISLFLKSKSK